MEAWLIYLIVSLWVMSIVTVLTYSRRSKRLVLVLVLSCLVVATPTVAWQQVDAAGSRARTAEYNTLVAKFNENYSTDSLLYDGYDQLYKAQRMEVYLISRAKLNDNGIIDTSAGLKQSMLIGSSWLEVQVTNADTGE